MIKIVISVILHYIIGGPTAITIYLMLIHLANQVDNTTKSALYANKLS